MINKIAELYYLCAGPIDWGLDIGISKKLSGHAFVTINDKSIIWPIRLSSLNCNPKNIQTIKSSAKIRDVLIIDRIKCETPTVNICGHVNRSGENYLIGMTPHYKYPQFPDMTHIYKTHPHKTSKTVHTIGPKRFKKAELNSKIIWSEGIRLVAPVFHYVGYNIKGFGVNSANLLKQYFC